MCDYRRPFVGDIDDLDALTEHIWMEYGLLLEAGDDEIHPDDAVSANGWWNQRLRELRPPQRGR